MKAQELQAYLRSLNGGWMDIERTVDTFKSGVPEAEITAIAIGWMSYTWALKKALDLGCNVFITHEPTYYDHYDSSQEVFQRLPDVRKKKQFIEERGLIILRCHDLWDQFPAEGIADSWGELLQLGKPIDGHGYFRVYDVAGKTAGEVAQQVARAASAFGQPAVQLIGSPDQPVTRAFTGTGAITPLGEAVVTYQADLAICSDDGFVYWRDGAYAIDTNLPVILVNHPVSEEAGLMSLAHHLQQQFPFVRVHHIPQSCMYRLVGCEEHPGRV
jgi:putative NIF3 family GTP cyclohydrolase 1 type 2